MHACNFCYDEPLMLRILRCNSKNSRKTRGFGKTFSSWTLDAEARLLKGRLSLAEASPPLHGGAPMVRLACCFLSRRSLFPAAGFLTLSPLAAEENQNKNTAEREREKSERERKGKRFFLAVLCFFLGCSLAWYCSRPACCTLLLSRSSSFWTFSQLALSSIVVFVGSRCACDGPSSTLSGHFFFFYLLSISFKVTLCNLYSSKKNKEKRGKALLAQVVPFFSTNIPANRRFR